MTLTRFQGRTYPLGKGRRLPWAPKSQGPPKMLLIFEMRIKRGHADGCGLRCILPRQPSACPSWTCFLCILLVANINIMHLKLTAARARGLSLSQRAHSSLPLSLTLSLCICSVPTLSHGNSYVFYEVANSYEFVRLHSYDLVRFV